LKFSWVHIFLGHPVYWFMYAEIFTLSCIRNVSHIYKTVFRARVIAPTYSHAIEIFEQKALFFSTHWLVFISLIVNRWNIRNFRQEESLWNSGITYIGGFGSEGLSLPFITGWTACIACWLVITFPQKLMKFLQQHPQLVKRFCKTTKKPSETILWQTWKKSTKQTFILPKPFNCSACNRIVCFSVFVSSRQNVSEPSRSILCGKGKRLRRDFSTLILQYIFQNSAYYNSKLNISTI